MYGARSIWQWDHFCAFDRTVGRGTHELMRRASRRPQVKGAVRPWTMPGYARDTRKPKRKQVAEPKAAMAQRLVDDSRSIWTLVECERMTNEHRHVFRCFAGDVEMVAATDRIVVVTLSDDSSGRFLRLLHHAAKNSAGRSWTRSCMLDGPRREAVCRWGRRRLKP